MLRRDDKEEILTDMVLNSLKGFNVRHNINETTHTISQGAELEEGELKAFIDEFENEAIEINDSAFEFIRGAVSELLSREPPDPREPEDPDLYEPPGPPYEPLIEFEE